MYKAVHSTSTITTVFKPVGALTAQRKREPIYNNNLKCSWTFLPEARHESVPIPIAVPVARQPQMTCQKGTHVGELSRTALSSSVLKMADACLVSWSPREGADVDNIMFYDDGWRAYINWVFVLREIILTINYTRISGIEFHPECFSTLHKLAAATSHCVRSEERTNYGIARLIVNASLSDRDEGGHYIPRSFLILLEYVFNLSKAPLRANLTFMITVTANLTCGRLAICGLKKPLISFNFSTKLLLEASTPVNYYTNKLTK